MLCAIRRLSPCGHFRTYAGIPPPCPLSLYFQRVVLSSILHRYEESCMCRFSFPGALNRKPGKLVPEKPESGHLLRRYNRSIVALQEPSNAVRRAVSAPKARSEDCQEENGKSFCSVLPAAGLSSNHVLVREASVGWRLLPELIPPFLTRPSFRRKKTFWLS